MLFRISAIVFILLCVNVTAAPGNAPALYKAEPGPFSVGVTTDLEVRVPDRNRSLQLTVAYPKGGSKVNGPFPLIVFFHGALCSGEGYAELADHWASHGYVVILPSHTSSGRPIIGVRVKTHSTEPFYLAPKCNENLSVCCDPF